MVHWKEEKLKKAIAISLVGGVIFAANPAFAAEPIMGDGNITVEEGLSYEKIIGGSIDKDVEQVQVNIKGEVNTLSGGSTARTQNVKAGNVEIEISGNARVGTIQGGGLGTNGYTSEVDSSLITVKDNAVVNGINGGGGSEGGNTHVAQVVINLEGGTVGQLNNWGGITGGGYTYQGGKSSVDQAEINISSGQVLGNVAGGGTSEAGGGESLVGKSTINIEANAKVHGNVNGGGYAELGGKSNVGTTIINFSKVADMGQNFIYGGGQADSSGSLAAVDQATINVLNSVKKEGNIYGGAQVFDGAKGTVGSSTINIINSEVSSIYGNAYVEKGTATMGEVAINIKNSAVNDKIVLGALSVGSTSADEVTKASLFVDKDSKVLGNIFGGGRAANSSSTGNKYQIGGDSKVAESNIFIDGDVQNVYGGGRVDGNGTGTTSVGKSLISITDNAVVNQSIFGGGRMNSLPEYSATGKSKVEKSEIYILGGTVKGDVYAGGEGIGSRVEQAQVNISGGRINGNINGQGIKGATVGTSALNFTAGTGSSIGGKVFGFDTVTVATDAKTDWTGDGLTHTFGSLIVDEGGTINVKGGALTFDLGQVSSAASYSRMARAAQNGNFNINGEVNLAKGTTLTMQNGTITTGTNGAFVSAVDKTALANSGKLNWDKTTVVKGDLHLDFSDISADDLEAMGQTSAFADLVGAVAGTPASADGKEVVINNRENSTAEVDFSATLASDGVNVTSAPRIAERGFSYYTGVRQGNAYIVQNMVDNIHEHTAGVRNGGKADEFWAGIRGGSTDVGTRFGDTEVKTQFYQLGYDWDLSSNNEKAAIGLYFTKIAGNSTLNGVKNDIESAYDFGIYGTKEFSGGNYLSLLGRYGQIGNSLNINGKAVNWKDKGYGMSMEFGNRSTKTSGLILEPYIQLNYNHLSSVDFTTSMGTSVTVDGGGILDGKIGLRLIQQDKTNPRNAIFGGIAYSRGLSGDFALKTDGGTQIIEDDNDANAFEVLIGINRQISKCSTVNLNAKKEFGDYDGWSLQGSLNVSF